MLPIDGDPTARPRGATFGAFVTAIGLAIIAVGVTAVVRAQMTRHMPLMRPAVVIAASGQFVLLLGLIALAVQGGRAAKNRQGAPAGSLQTALGPMRYALAVQHGPDAAAAGWSPGAGPRADQAGQIAQLKTQLVCLAEQLDQLR